MTRMLSFFHVSFKFHSILDNTVGHSPSLGTGVNGTTPSLYISSSLAIFLLRFDGGVPKLRGFSLCSDFESWLSASIVSCSLPFKADSLASVGGVSMLKGFSVSSNFESWLALIIVSCSLRSEIDLLVFDGFLLFSDFEPLLPIQVLSVPRLRLPAPCSNGAYSLPDGPLHP